MSFSGCTYPYPYNTHPLCFPTEARSTTVLKTFAFVHSAISPYGGQPEHYRHENAL